MEQNSPVICCGLNWKIGSGVERLFLCALFAMLAATTANAQQAKVSIESFQVIQVNSESVDIELIGSNDGSLGQICVGVIAKSKDGTVRSDRYQPMVLPIGIPARVVAQVQRPRGWSQINTDFLQVMVYPCGKEMYFRHKFAWAHSWPAIQATIPGEGADDPDLGSSNPELVFYMNMVEEEFAALDMLLEKWNNPKERDVDGNWKLNGFGGALGRLFQAKDWGESIEFIRKWQKANFRSAGAAIAEARYWMSYASRIRGEDARQDVPQVVMNLYRDRMMRSEQALIKAKKFSMNNPLWYKTYLDVALASGHDGKFAEAVYENGIRRHPYFQPIYLSMVKYWLPIQGKEAHWDKVDALVSQAVTLTSEIDGRANYARIYAHISSLLEIEIDIFKESFASWNKLKLSFDELVAPYPSASNLNEYAIFACRAGDGEVFLRIRQKLTDRVLAAKWPSNYSIDLCDRKFMRFSALPGFVVGPGV